MEKVAIAALLVVAACAGKEPSREAASPQPDSTPSEASASAAPATMEFTKSSIDARMQAIAEEELASAASAWNEAAGTVIVLDAHTGEVRALAGPAFATTLREPGSTLKTLLYATALERGVLALDEPIDCGHGVREFADGVRLADVRDFGTLTATEAFARSSNVGASRVFDRVGEDPMRAVFSAVGFDAPISVGERTALAFEVRSSFAANTFVGATVALGHGLKVSPLHLAAAYTAIADDGIFHAARAVAGGSGAGRRAFRPEIARKVRGLLAAVVASGGTGEAAAIEGVSVGGKTGTAPIAGRVDASYGSFVGLAPLDAPRFVVLVGLQVARPKEEGASGTGGKLAAPVFARVVSRLLSE
ncbi:MAG: penicillin-binding transpeptidase domain-containing protein [Polyangiaceae bacterium]